MQSYIDFVKKSNRVVSFYFPEFKLPALFEKVREKFIVKNGLYPTAFVDRVVLFLYEIEIVY